MTQTMSLSKTALTAASAMKKISSLASFHQETLKRTELKDSKLLPVSHWRGCRHWIWWTEGRKRQKNNTDYILFYVSLNDFVHLLPCSCDRNYHVFYYLLAGSTPELKTALDLTEPSDYLYLSQVSDWLTVLVTGEWLTNCTCHRWVTD